MFLMSIDNNISVPICNVNKFSDEELHNNSDMSIGERVREARKEAGLTQKQLADKVGVSQPALSELENGDSYGTTKLAAMASALNVSALWLETGRGPRRQVGIVSSHQHGEQYADEGRVVVRLRTSSPEPEGIEIPQYNGVGGSMGNGLILRDQPGEIYGWRVDADWITKNVKSHTGAGNLRIVTGFGDSMRPLFNPGDPLLVDAGVKAVEFDSIYFFRIGDEGFIKRLQRVPGQGLVAISENKSYRDWVITADMDFEVFARVIKVWCGSDF